VLECAVARQSLGQHGESSSAWPFHAASSRVRALKDALAPWHAGYDYYTFVETPAEAEVVLPPASYERMRNIRGTYDPDQTIIPAHPQRAPSPRDHWGNARAGC
jgi:hypothetical protein